jgi:hypothetical protein
MFLSKFWYLTTGVPMFSGTIMLCPEYIFAATLYHQMGQIGSYLHIKFKYLYLGTLGQLPPLQCSCQNVST